MARRGGKAANRRDRQRRAQRRAQQRPAPQPRPVSSTLSEAIEEAAEQRASAPAAPAPPVTRGGRADPRFSVAGPSRLGERAAAEYHYVVRDLRNIGVLVVIMAILLGVAVVAFNALGIGPA
ncbi:MAG TPA: hypothetical protein VI733_02430 [Candidatus Limnocylindria bacterium]|nr:hypothetical protein [Candidatus Limnocylindria bacterium]